MEDERGDEKWDKKWDAAIRWELAIPLRNNHEPDWDRDLDHVQERYDTTPPS